MANTLSDDTGIVPRDEYSTELRRMSNHPKAINKQTIVETADFYGNVVQWIVRTLRAEGETVIFLSRNGERFVLPAKVVQTLLRQQDTAKTVVRKRAAKQAAATREALGIKPNFKKKGTHS